MKIISLRTVKNGGGCYTRGEEYELVKEGRRVLIKADDNGSMQCQDYCKIEDLKQNTNFLNYFSFT